MNLYFLIIGILTFIIGLSSVLLPKKMSSWWALRGWFWTKDWRTLFLFMPTAKKVLGEEEGAKFTFWIGLFVLAVGLGFIIYGILT